MAWQPCSIIYTGCKEIEERRVTLDCTQNTGHIHGWMDRRTRLPEKVHQTRAVRLGQTIQPQKNSLIYSVKKDIHREHVEGRKYMRK